MAVGKPLLMAVNGDAADLVRQAKCGLTAESENPQALADAVDTLVATPADELKTMGESASRFYQAAMSLQVGAAKFAAVFERFSRKEHRLEI
jgi:glycosyltransferase involved in cell wall biosynthesis